MSSELSLFEEFNTPVEVPTQAVLTREAIIAETKRLVEEDNELEKEQENIERRHQEILVRRFEIRVQIGTNLLILQLGHANEKNGDFTTSTIPEVGISVNKAYDCMRVAKLVTQRLRNTLPENAFSGKVFPWEVWRELARPSTDETVVTQVIEGTVESTPKAIKEANQRVKELKEQNKQLQTKFDFHQQYAQQQEELLNAKIDELEQELTVLSQPQTIIEEKQVIPPETLEHIQKLEAEKDKSSDHSADVGKMIQDVKEGENNE